MIERMANTKITSTSFELMVSISSVWILLFVINSCAGYPSQYNRQQQLLHQQQQQLQSLPFYQNYLPELYNDADYEEPTNDYNNNNLYPYSNNINYNNNWNVAQEPIPYSSYDHFTPEDYDLGNNNNDNDLKAEWAEIEALSNLLALYDANQEEQQKQPTWGHIVKEEPAELELEELKNNKKKVGENQKAAGTAALPKVPQPTVKFLENPVKPSVAPVKITGKSGQKEVPLLRPPAPKPQQQEQQQVLPVNNNNNNEPVPVIAQRSSDKKPSPYDTLRKYLSIEDALKKEAEKRRSDHVSVSSSGNSRQKKSNFVADEQSLTGQLTNLKKSVT